MKVLVYMAYNALKPTGGPRGYLYNLDKGLKQIEDDEVEICYLPDHAKEKYKASFNKLPKAVKQFYFDHVMLKRTKHLLADSVGHYATIDINKYDLIHFHSSLTLLSVRDSLKDYRGIVLLTNHSPKPQHKEWIEDVISIREYQRHSIIYNQLSELEARAYNLADYIVFPCEEAEEPCINNWSLYREIKEKNKQKYRYILTGTGLPLKTLNREEVCQKYNIPEDTFIINYVGRHNSTKGYDSLLKIGEKILEKHKNVYFLIAGKEGPLYGLNHERWIEVGWINDPGTYYSSSDIFILPNKETYFDLVMLEALASETVILASKTGGNKYFEKYNSDGIVLYSDIDDAVAKLDALLNLGHKKLKELARSNTEVYQSQYTVQKFAKGYLSLWKSLAKR